MYDIALCSHVLIPKSIEYIFLILSEVHIRGKPFLVSQVYLVGRFRLAGNGRGFMQVGN